MNDTLNTYYHLADAINMTTGELDEIISSLRYEQRQRRKMILGLIRSGKVESNTCQSEQTAIKNINNRIKEFEQLREHLKSNKKKRRNFIIERLVRFFNKWKSAIDEVNRVHENRYAEPYE